MFFAVQECVYVFSYEGGGMTCVHVWEPMIIMLMEFLCITP